MQYVFVAYAFSFLVLFGNFYRLTYFNQRKTSKKSVQSSSTLASDQTKSIHKSPNQRDFASFFASFGSAAAASASSGSGSDSGSTGTGKKSSRHSKQSKLSMLNAKHNYGQIGRRKKVKSG